MRYHAAPLLLVAFAVAIDPPAKLWEIEYYESWDFGEFRDVELDQNGNLFITGLVYSWAIPSVYDNYVAFLLDIEGNIIWEVPHEYYGESAYDGAVLPDGSFVVTGSATEDSTSSSIGLIIHKIDLNGQTVWSKLYDYPDTKEVGYGITCLPDSGFAVCGRVHGTGLQQGQAWILRTDAQGDTLWTRTWGTHTERSTVHFGKSIFFNKGELCILAKGTDDTLTTNGTHMLFYDLDGNYLRGTDYPELYYLFPASLCATADGGYTFTTESFPPVWHTDQYGETLWWKGIYVTPNDWHKGYCIRTTMDNGYIFCGWDGYFEYEPDGRLVDYQEGWLARFDSDGNELWNINNTISVNHHFYSCLQLPEGGYIACGAYGVFESMDGPESRGSTGYLVRYAPETGISESEPVNDFSLEVSPNPCSSVLSVSFAQPEVGNASVQVFDLSGRLVSQAAEGEFPDGISAVEWTVPEELPSGCYFIRVSNGCMTAIEGFVILR